MTKKLMGTRSVWAVGLAVGMLALVPASAHAVLLSDLFAGDEITVDDKLFSEWEDEFGDCGVFVDCDSIEVTGLPDDPSTSLSDPGLKFTASAGALTAGAFEELLFSFNFKVTVLDPSLEIVGASIALTDFFLDPTDPFASIVINDTVFSADLSQNFGTMTVDTFSGPLADEIGGIPKVNMVIQEVDIFIDNLFGSEATGINMFEIRKIQIPEPSSLSLFGVGFAGLALMLGWRQRRRTVNAA